MKPRAHAGVLVSDDRPFLLGGLFASFPLGGSSAGSKKRGRCYAGVLCGIAIGSGIQKPSERVCALLGSFGVRGSLVHGRASREKHVNFPTPFFLRFVQIFPLQKIP